MSSKGFLTTVELDNAQSLLLPPMVPPSGEWLEGQPLPAKDFSSWLSMALESRFRKNKNWFSAHPIAIGSWGRNELCPQSDVDVLFAGDKTAVEDIVAMAEKEKIPLRYRYPKNNQDWGDGANIFEVNALFWARPFTKQAAEALQWQKKIVFEKKNIFRKQLLKEIVKEQEKRNQRYDSVANYLEPQLKYGAGGLRDIQQALMVWYWYNDKLGGHVETFATLHHLNDFILTLRQKMHLCGYADVLVAPAQRELADWFGYNSSKEFMREVQKVLARVSFYCDWVFAEAPQKNIKSTSVSDKKQKTFKELPLRKPEQVFQSFQKSPSYSLQKEVLHNISSLDWSYHKKFPKLFNARMADSTLRAIFDSHLFHAIIPDFKKIEGVVQHDQYHRFTVDAHLLQAMRWVLKIKKRPHFLGPLAKLAKQCSDSDWEILLWTALYHDLGKARDKDHSIEGKELALTQLPLFGFKEKFVEEVAWLVENHLVLSTAAFRKDPKSPKLWGELYRRGIHGERLRRLTLFTAIDINATNPEAWTDWKETLLWQLWSNLTTPQGNQLLGLLKKANKYKLTSELIHSLDLALISSLPNEWILRDLKKVIHQENPSIELFNKKDKGLWVRFFNPKDQAGLFFTYVTQLWQVGASIRHAYIHTLPNVGVYDWFQVKSTRTTQQLQNMLNLTAAQSLSSVTQQSQQTSEISTSVATVPLKVSLVSASEQEWVMSFQGTDSKGVLLLAAQTLFQMGLQIRWAKVHTWGQQIDDIFGIIPTKDGSAEEWTRQIEQRLRALSLQN